MLKIEPSLAEQTSEVEEKRKGRFAPPFVGEMFESLWWARCSKGARTLRLLVLKGVMFEGLWRPWRGLFSK